MKTEQSVTAAGETSSSGAAQDAARATSSISSDAYRVGFQDDLLHDLNRIRFSGSFASFGALPSEPPAGLHVSGVGDIRMPLDQSQAQQLIAKARQAPYGKGSETLVDTAVRNTWELDPDQFTFRNPAWADYVQKITSLIHDDLGVRARIKAELYKMLIYEKGALFKPHTDTEKIPNMFGTLVICLPSAHEGGEVVLKHCGKTKTFRTSAAKQSFACWYSDVTHEVLPVKSGYRWVLTYNLAASDVDVAAPRPSAGLQRSDTILELRKTLRRWLSNSPVPRPGVASPQEHEVAVHILAHEYTEASLSFQALKARDLAQVETLIDLSKELPFNIFLALVEKEETGECGNYANHDLQYGIDDDDMTYHGIDEVIDQFIRFKTVVDLNGRKLLDDREFDEDWLLDVQAFDDMVGEESYEGYMGNSGPMATHWYRVGAVVLVPHHNTSKFLMGKGIGGKSTLSYDNCQSLIQYTAEECMGQSQSGSSIALVQDLCELTWETWKTEIKSDRKRPAIAAKSMVAALRAALRNKDFGFLERNARFHQAALPTDFFQFTCQWMGIGQLHTESVQHRFSLVRNGLTQLVFHYTTLKQQLEAVSKLIPSPGSPLFDAERCPAFLLDWARETLESCVRTNATRGLSGEEGHVLVYISRYWNEPTSFLQVIAANPMLNPKCKAPAFWLSFVNRLSTQLNEVFLPMGACTALFRELVPSLLAEIKFSELHTEGTPTYRPGEPSPTCQHTTLLDGPVPPCAKLTTPESLLNFASVLIDMSTSESGNFLHVMASRMTEEPHAFPHKELSKLWLPFLQSLAPVLHRKSVPMPSRPLIHLYSSILNACLDKVIGREPAMDRAVVMRPVPCSCRDCTELNLFLLSTTQRVGRFPVSKPRRHHLHQILDQYSVACTHQTERFGTPQTLVVTKTVRQSDLAHQRWQGTVEMMKQYYARFNEGDLLLLLGENYERIVGMRHLFSTAPESPASGARQVPLSSRILVPSASANRLAPVAGQKRKRPFVKNEVVDLTED